MTALVWAVAAFGFTVVTIVRLGRRAGRNAPTAVPGRVLLLRPTDAPSPAELAALYVPLRAGPAVEHVVVSTHPRPPDCPRELGWLVSRPATPNRKVGHLLHALARMPVPDGVVLSVDADVAVDGALVGALASAVAGGAALAWAVPAPAPARGLPARAARAVLCHSHLCFRALDVMRAGAPAVCGKAVGLGPAALALLPETGDRVGEDLEIARRLHRAGHDVVAVATPARMPPGDGAGLVPALDRYTRWMRVLRAHRPASWTTVPLLFAPSLPLALIAVVVRSPSLAVAVAALWFARTLLARRLEPRGCLAWPLGEALVLAAFVRSLGRRPIAWRGRRLRVARGGRIVGEAT